MELIKKHKYFVQHDHFKMTFNNMLLRLFCLTSFFFSIIIEIAIMSAKSFYGQRIVACNVGNNTLYWSHSLGGSVRNDQTIKWDKSAINKLGISPCQPSRY